MSNTPRTSAGGSRFPQLDRLGGTGGGMLRWGLVGVILLMLLVCGGITLLRGGVPPLPFRDPNVATPTVGGAFGNGPMLGELVTTSAIDGQNRPLAVIQTFPSHIPRIYAVLQGLHVPAGTSYYTRWTREGQLYTQTQPLVAGQEYTNTFIEFHVDSINGVFPPGHYGVQVFPNGSPGPAAAFDVQ